MKQSLCDHENLEWTQHLVKWLEELEVPYELWDCLVEFWTCKVHRHKVSFIIACLHLLTPEDIAMPPEFTEQVITWLEAYGRKVVNGTGAINLEISKSQTIFEVKRVGY